MRENYITRMPDKAGSFLKAARAIASCGGNITRVSYSKAIDVHTLFIEVEGSKTQLCKITEELSTLGYIKGNSETSRVIILEFRLKDEPGVIVPVLEILTKYDINISYINSQENGSGYQFFKMGLFIDDASIMKKLLDELSALCPVRIIDYDMTEKSLDNTIYYLSIANDLQKLLNLSDKDTNELVIASNQIMQILDEKGETPMKTFEYIGKFARFAAHYKGNNFMPRISERELTDDIKMTLIEPPCGSNCYILRHENELMFVDCGFACYSSEMTAIFKLLFPDFENMQKSIVITHADIDHVGLLYMFDKVYMNKSCYDNFALENAGENNFREQYRPHMAFCRMSKLITGYKPPKMDNLIVVGEKKDGAVLSYIGKISFAGMEMLFYEGLGGHVRGESVIACPSAKTVFTGDCLLNVKGYTSEQKSFNYLSPYLMQSVNVDSAKALTCREMLEKEYKGWLICPGHGTFYDG